MLILGMGFSCKLPAQTAEANNIKEIRDPKLKFLEEFSDDIHSCSKRWNVTVIAEDEPFKKMSNVKIDLNDPKIDYKSAMKFIEEKYDFTVEIKGNIWVLTKKYTEDEDVPAISMPQAIYTLRAAISGLGLLDPKAPTSDFSYYRNAIMKSLTPNQLDRLSKGGVPISELGEAERQPFLKMGLECAFNVFYIQDFKDSLKELEIIRSSDALMKWKKIKERSVFGYDKKSIRPGQVEFVSLSYNPTFRFVSTKTGLEVEGPPDTLPSDATNPYSPFRETIAVKLPDILKRLKSRDGESKVEYLSDSFYSDSRFTLSGIEKNSSIDILKGLQSILGFRYSKIATDRFLLTVPYYTMPGNYHEIGMSMQSIQPPAFKRYFERKLWRKSQTQDSDKASELATDFNNYIGILDKTTLPVERWFRFVAEKEIDESPTKTKLFSTMGERAKALFAASHFMKSAASIEWFSHCRMPPFLEDFDHAILTGKDGVEFKVSATRVDEYMKIYLSNIDPVTGEMHEGVGFDRIFMRSVNR